MQKQNILFLLLAWQITKCSKIRHATLTTDVLVYIFHIDIALYLITRIAILNNALRKIEAFS